MSFQTHRWFNKWSIRGSCCDYTVVKFNFNFMIIFRPYNNVVMMQLCYFPWYEIYFLLGDFACDFWIITRFDKCTQNSWAWEHITELKMLWFPKNSRQRTNQRANRLYRKTLVVVKYRRKNSVLLECYEYKWQLMEVIHYFWEIRTMDQYVLNLWALLF